MEAIPAITDVPGGILFANRIKGQRNQISATILASKLSAALKIAGAEAVKDEGLSPANFIGGLEKDG